MLADLAWGHKQGLASLDLAEVEVYSVVQWQLARLAQGLDMKKPAKILKDFIKKSLVVVWVSSFQRCLHDGLYQVLAKRFNRLAKLVVSSVSSTTTAMPTHEHQIQPGDESPSIVLDLPDRLVVQKPPSWQVDDGKDDPESSRGRLSTFLSTRFSCPILREVEHQRGFLHRLDVPTSGLILVAKEHRAYYDLQLQLAAGQVAREYVVLCHGRLPVKANDERCIDARLDWGLWGRDVPSGLPARS
ncbi:Ribosomal large subunit pseudouridine synthase D [Durusdinium trenchii]|uniref:Ribosomal large subunit pseudouridine synthase D n=1 Tax=Durusdinium trenchii TaxID=1381693 RepID=A0ABP0H7F7_9DINO